VGRPQKLPDSFTKYIISHSPTKISKIGPRDDLRIHFLNRLILKLVMLRDICVPKKLPFLRKKSM
jgi:hypothetical protein